MMSTKGVRFSPKAVSRRSAGSGIDTLRGFAGRRDLQRFDPAIRSCEPHTKLRIVFKGEQMSAEGKELPSWAFPELIVEFPFLQPHAALAEASDISS